MRPTQARIHAIMSNNKMANTLKGSTTTVNIAVCNKENVKLINVKDNFSPIVSYHNTVLGIYLMM
jgi:hypothetical protein